MNEDFADPFVIPIGRRRSRQDRAEGFHWFGFEDSLTIGLRLSQLGVFIKLFLGADPIWGKVNDDGIELNYSAFIKFFGENWDALWLERFPDNVSVTSVSEWWPTVRRNHRNSSTSALRLTLQNQWDTFRSRHCLSDLLLKTTDDALLPEVWFVGDGASMLIDVPELALRKMVPIGAAMNCIERACNMIAMHALSSVTQGEQEKSAISVWRSRRDQRPVTELVSLFVGLDDDELVGRISSGLPSVTTQGIFNHHSEVMAAARMRPSGLSHGFLGMIFDEIDRTKKVETRELDDLSEKTITNFRSLLDSKEPPYVQGAEIASWLRDQLNYDVGAMLNPAILLSDWHVSLREVAILNGDLDAIAVWGPRHGPAVILNRNGRHSRRYAGRRATLAHEICHLLIDRKENLPLGDIVGGRVPEQIEQRARAFAAELLFPQRVAYEMILQTDLSLHEVAGVLGAAMKSFRVSKWIAAHQVQNGIRRFHGDVHSVQHILAYIDSITSLDWINSSGVVHS